MIVTYKNDNMDPLAVPQVPKHYITLINMNTNYLTVIPMSSMMIASIEKKSPAMIA
jgi:hypothetical protein